MCIFLTRIFTCPRPDGMTESHSLRFTVSCSMAPVPVGWQPCTYAPDYRNEYYDFACEQCSGEAFVARSDDAGDGLQRVEYNLYETRTAESDEQLQQLRQRHSYAVRTYALGLAQLLWFHLKHEANDGKQGDSAQRTFFGRDVRMPEEFYMIAYPEAMCRMWPNMAHEGFFDPFSRYAHKCDCPQSVDRFMNNAAVDLRLYGISSALEEQGDRREKRLRRDPDLRAFVAKLQLHYMKNLSVEKQNGQPVWPVIPYIKPFNNLTMQFRVHEITRALFENERDLYPDPYGYKSWPRYEFLHRAIELLATDTGLELTRAKHIAMELRPLRFRWLQASVSRVDAIYYGPGRAGQELSKLGEKPAAEREARVRLSMELLGLDPHPEHVAENLQYWLARVAHFLDNELREDTPRDRYGVNDDNRVVTIFDWMEDVRDDWAELRNEVQAREGRARANMVEMSEQETTALIEGGDDACPICTENYLRDELGFERPVRLKNCGHAVGRCCLLLMVAMADTEPKCPLCRKELSPLPDPSEDSS